MKYLSRCNGIPLPARLAAINFLCSLALYSSNIFMPLYAQEHEASRFQIGLIVSAWGTAYFVSSFIFGRLSDRRGRLVFIRLGLGLAVAAYLLQIVARDPVPLLAVRALVGFCLGVSSAAMMAYVYEAEGQVGRFASYGSLGWLCGCVVRRRRPALRRPLCASAAGPPPWPSCCPSLSGKRKAGRSRCRPFPCGSSASNIRVYVPFFLRCLGSYARLDRLPPVPRGDRGHQVLGGHPGRHQHGVPVCLDAVRGAVQGRHHAGGGPGRLGDRLRLIRPGHALPAGDTR